VLPQCYAALSFGAPPPIRHPSTEPSRLVLHEPAEDEAEQGVPERLLREDALGPERRQMRFAAARVAGVHEGRERVEEHVLGECEAEREPARLDARPAADGVEREAEERAVRRVRGE